jgi:hypothetical protein
MSYEFESILSKIKISRDTKTSKRPYGPMSVPWRLLRWTRGNAKGCKASLIILERCHLHKVFDANPQNGNLQSFIAHSITSSAPSLFIDTLDKVPPVNSSGLYHQEYFFA